MAGKISLAEIWAKSGTQSCWKRAVIAANATARLINENASPYRHASGLIVTSRGFEACRQGKPVTCFSCPGMGLYPTVAITGSVRFVIGENDVFDTLRNFAVAQIFATVAISTRGKRDSADLFVALHGCTTTSTSAMLHEHLWMLFNASGSRSLKPSRANKWYGVFSVASAAASACAVCGAGAGEKERAKITAITGMDGASSDLVLTCCRRWYWIARSTMTPRRSAV